MSEPTEEDVTVRVVMHDLALAAQAMADELDVLIQATGREHMLAPVIVNFGVAFINFQSGLLAWLIGKFPDLQNEQSESYMVLNDKLVEELEERNGKL